MLQATDAHHILHELQVAQAESKASLLTPGAWREAPQALLHFVATHVKTVTGMLNAAAELHFVVNHCM